MNPTVTPILGEPLRFHVSSAKSPYDDSPPYLVDLEEFDFNGQCDCPHFDFRMKPVLEESPGNGPLRCKHIIAVREFFLDQQIRDVAAHSNGQPV